MEGDGDLGVRGQVPAGTPAHLSCVRSLGGCSGAVEGHGVRGAGPAAGEDAKTVLEALCKVVLNMQHHHKYIYISTVRCVGFLQCVLEGAGGTLPSPAPLGRV